MSGISQQADDAVKQIPAQQSSTKVPATENEQKLQQTVFGSKEHFQRARKLAYDRKMFYETAFGEKGTGVKEEIDFRGIFQKIKFLALFFSAIIPSSSYSLFFSISFINYYCFWNVF